MHVDNPIPLGRGLGSSGAAVVAGVALANEVGNLDLDRRRILDYCLMIGMCIVPVENLNTRMLADIYKNATQIM